ncbi:MAG: ATP-binding cassette domain-containing protein [Actinomycetota bacterium]|nr:ATP-binding cassette domain-containing protein [Actinomycetota bacterium]
MTELLSWQTEAEHIDDPVISCQGVTKQFGSHRVLDGVTYDVPRGKTTAILGPSGTGKSVMLKVIIGLLKPEAGQIIVDGEPVVGISEKNLLRIRRKFGVLFQDGALFGSMSLYDNIAFPMREHTKASEKEIRVKVMENAELVGLVAHLDKTPGEVSGGMKKRAGLARALVLEPPIILFDEPDSGLDPVRVAYLDELVNTAQQETGSTFFIITHNIESVNRTAHYLGLLFRSKLVAFGSKESMNSTENPVIRQFLAGRPEGPISMDEMAEDDRGAASDKGPGAKPDNTDPTSIDQVVESDGTRSNGTRSDNTRSDNTRSDTADSHYDDEDWETPPGR